MKTVGEWKAAGMTHLRVVCGCGRSEWIPWAQLPFGDDDSPEDHLKRFKCQAPKCKAVGRHAAECIGTKQYNGWDSSKMVQSSN